MNIAVINAKDLFRYILKFLVIVSITFFMVKILKTIDLKKQEDNIKENTPKTIPITPDKLELFLFVFVLLLLCNITPQLTQT